MKNILITGASGGVGGMLAKGLAQKGHHIICLGRKEDRLLRLVEVINSLGGSASYGVADMMDEKAVQQAGEKVMQDVGSIEVWINNVGVNNHNAIGPSWELEAKNWWREVSLNLYTAYLGSMAAIRLMKANNYGYIINLGGGGVQKPKPFGSAYGAAKTALVKFTETLNLELEAEGLGIKVFAFNPGFIRNARTEILVESEVARTYMPELEQILKYGQMSEPQDSIDLIEALLSGKADELGGRYFFADDKNIQEAISNKETLIQEDRNLLRVRL
ncbi:MAG: SDR family oxidoreductase [Bacteroidota bacterium]